MPRCPYCRAINNPGATNCVRCHKPLVSPDRSTAETSPASGSESSGERGVFQGIASAASTSPIRDSQEPVTEAPPSGPSALDHFSADAPTGPANWEASTGDLAGTPPWGAPVGEGRLNSAGAITSEPGVGLTLKVAIPGSWP